MNINTKYTIFRHGEEFELVFLFENLTATYRTTKMAISQILTIRVNDPGQQGLKYPDIFQEAHGSF